MPTALTLAQALLLLAPHIAELIQVLTEDTYDQDKERQALLNVQRAVADERVRRLLT